MTNTAKLIAHHTQLRNCRRCPNMIPPVITGNPVSSKIILIGQAPGNKEGELQRPFAWTAGKTLFKWFNSIGVNEAEFRQAVYMSAVCRCFPGKKPKGGDRVPSPEEIDNCSYWLNHEMSLLQPQLIIAVGKLAISQYMKVKTLKDVIGQQHQLTILNKTRDFIPLPHPSGASTWHHTEPGKSLLQLALQKIEQHPCWQELFFESN
jgi:uracil-DNA glycosylase